MDPDLQPWVFKYKYSVASTLSSYSKREISSINGSKEIS
jgi:hypothetical protein